MPELRPRTGKSTGIFAPFEWMIAGRYLRAKRQESFISVISLFSLIGIALGVATLIIVMSVMNGFRVELLKSILGLSGHVTVQSQTGFVTDYDAVTARIRGVPGVVRAAPIVDGQVMASQNGANAGVAVRGIRAADLAKITLLTDKLTPGRAGEFRRRRCGDHRQRPGQQAGPAGRQQHHADRGQGRCHAVRHHAAHQDLPGRRHLPCRQHSL